MKDSMWVNLLIGIWLIVAAFVLAPVSAVRSWNEVIFGIVLIVSSWTVLRAIRPTTTVWFEMLVGVWLIIAPFLLGYAFAAGKWNDVICGVVTIAISFIAMSEVNRTTRIA